MAAKKRTEHKAQNFLRSASSRSLAILVRVIPGGLRGTLNPRWALAAVGAALLTLGCTITFLARPSPLPMGGSWLTWWSSPLETAPYTRLTYTNAGFKSVAVSPDETTIWAVGDNGLALHSEDRGRSWAKIAVDPTSSPVEATVASVSDVAPKLSALDGGATAVPAPPNTYANAAATPAVSQVVQVSGAIPRYEFPRGSSSISPAMISNLAVLPKEFGAASLVYVTPYRTSNEAVDIAEQRGNVVRDLLLKYGFSIKQLQVVAPIVSTVPGVDVGLTRPTPPVQSPPARPLAPQAQVQSVARAQAPSATAPEAKTASKGHPNFTIACALLSSNRIPLTAWAANSVHGWAFNRDTNRLSEDKEPNPDDLIASSVSGSCIDLPANDRPRLVAVGTDLGRLIQVGPTTGSRARVLAIEPGRKATFIRDDLTTVLTFPPGNYTANSGFIGDNHLSIVTSDAKVLSVSLSGGTLQPTMVTNTDGQPGTLPLHAIYFLNSGLTGWVVGDGGAVYRTRDSGMSWPQIASLADSSTLRSVIFNADGLTGWGAGDGGLYGSDNGGVTWSPVVLRPENLKAWLSTPSTSFKLAGDDVLQRCPVSEAACSNDTTRNVPLPAPLAFLAFSFALVAFTLAGFAPQRFPSAEKADARENEGGASAYASDRPLKQGDFDLLNLGNIARGLAAFLVNRRTEPPLSVAVDGPWGSGKSSLLNLFVAQAPRNGFRIVWFNAWHHEKEENTLGAILEMICRDAIPAFFSPFGFAMRLNLLWSRVLAKPVEYLAAQSLVVFLVAAAIANPRIPAEWLHGGATAVTNVVSGESNTGPPKIAQNSDPVGTIAGYIPITSGILAALYFLFNLQTKLMALAKTADGVMPRVVITRDRRALMTNVGLRKRFAREFDAVTKAMRPMRLVIVIDDLDRCQPSKVVEILQLVNFLMTSGDCFVVTAADLRFVEACVRQEYKDVGGLLFSNAEQTAEHGVAANDGLVEFARRYLRKIVNVVVRIPRMTSEQSKTFVSRDAMVDREEEKITAHSSLRAYGAWGLATIVAVVLPLLLAQEVVPPGGTGPAATQQQTPAQNPPSADNSAPQPLTGAPAPNAAPQQPPLEELYVKAATPGRPSWWWFLLPVGILGFFASVAWQVWRIVEATRKTDSKTFTEALGRWVPLVYEQTPTPRDIRRFTNQTRYLAAQNAYSSGVKLSDEQLVKYATLEWIDPAWFDGVANSTAFEKIESEARRGEMGSLPPDWPEDLKLAARDALASTSGLGQFVASIEDYRQLASRSKWPEA